MTQAEARKKKLVPEPLELMRTGMETLSVTGTVCATGLVGPTAAQLGTAMGSTLSGVTVALGVLQVLSGVSSGDKRKMTAGGLGVAIGATGMASGLMAMGGGTAHPILGVAAVGLLATRIAYTVKNGGPIA